MSSIVLLPKITSSAESTAPTVLLTSKASMGRQFPHCVGEVRTSLARSAATIGFRFPLATAASSVLGASPRDQLSPALYPRTHAAHAHRHSRPHAVDAPAGQAAGGHRRRA